MITLTIDGKQIQSEKGKRILEAALENGIYIPNLCALADIELPFGACRLCFVEIEGKKGMVTSCTEPIREGMVVSTVTPDITKLRRNILDFILSKHPHECLTCYKRDICDPLQPCLRTVSVEERCVVCPKDKNCDLQRCVEYVGLAELHAPYQYKNLPTHDDPLIARDYNLCILCGRCVRACQDIRGIGAIAFTFRGSEAVVGTIFGDSLKESGCKFCGACVEVCPTGALADRDLRWKKNGDRRAALVPCTHACPAGIDVPRYVRLAAEGKFAEGLAVIREKVPFPGVLGHVCFHTCEEVCRRGRLNDPISIRAIKRFLAENGGDSWKEKSKVASSTGKKVAVVGSGPAGLSAAYYLKKKGHGVTVFESLPEPGGMMRAGIPEYRLPRAVLRAEIEEITGIGVEIRTNSPVESVDALLGEGYQAIFVAVGAHRDVMMGIEGEEGASRVLRSIGFLQDVNLGKEVTVGDKVIVVGGGNSAIESARVARRLGASQVTIAFSGDRSEMSARPEELDEAIEEGIELKASTTPTGLTAGDSAVKLECSAPEGAATLEGDTLIVAIDQAPEIPEGFGLPVLSGNRLKADTETLATGRPGVFAGGDATTGPGSIIQAIASGRKAASAIDRYLGGDGDIDETLAPAEEPEAYFGRDEGFGDWPRVAMPCLEPEQRTGGFDEVQLGYDEESALGEARRCLKCDLRFRLDAMLPMSAVARK